MKKFFAAIILLTTLVTASAFANPIAADGTFKGIKLWGKVKAFSDKNRQNLEFLWFSNHDF